MFQAFIDWLICLVIGAGIFVAGMGLGVLLQHLFALAVAYQGFLLWFPGSAMGVSFHLLVLGAQAGVALALAYSIVKLAISYILGHRHD